VPTRTPIDALREYESGQRLRAGDVNALIAEIKNLPELPDVSEPIETDLQNVGDFGLNDSGATATAGAIVRPTVQFDVGAGKRGWKFNKPRNDMPQAKLVIDVDRDVANGGSVAARWAWRSAWCLYTGTDPVLFERWGTSAASWSLSKGKTGDFLALGAMFQVGSNKFGLFKQIVGQPIIAVTNGSLSHGSSCEVEQLARVTSWARTGNKFSAYDVFLNSGETLDTGTIVRVQDYGVPTIDAMYCNANDWLD